MAADQTAILTGHLTLVANASMTINLTGKGKRVELIHQGGAATEAVYYKVATTEAAADTLAGGGTDEERILLSGERLMVNVPRSASGTVWIGLRSTGTPVVSAELVAGGV